MIKRLLYVLFAVLLGAAALAPGQAARAMPAGMGAGEPDVLRIGSPGFPPPAVQRHDPTPRSLFVDRPSPSTQPGTQAVATTITFDYVPSGVTDAMGLTCITFPEQAKAALNDAAAILKTLIASPVDIRIEACWTTFSDSSTLGTASTIYISRDFPNAPQPGIYYPVALANALSGTDRVPASVCTGAATPRPASNCDDITVAYGNGYLSSFYFPTDGNPGSKTDFETVVLNGLIHGLAFFGNMYAYQDAGNVWWGDLWNTTYPYVYDYYAANSSGTSLTDTALYPLPSTALGSVLVGANGGAYFNGPNTRIANGGVKAKLYTPNPWDSGSSYSNLDTSFDGTPNALMTWTTDPGEAIHSPGPVGYGVLKDVGWAPWPASTLTATYPSTTQTSLSWADNSSNETGFRLERSLDGATGWSPAGTVGAGVTTTTNAIVTVPADYYYRVVAYHALGDAYPSNVVARYGVPTTLTLAAPLPNQVTLSWANGSAGATAFTVQRSPTGAAGNWASLPAGGSLTGYTDNGVADGIRYYYRISATGPSGGSPFSPAFSVVTPLVKATGLVATAASDSQINVAWVNNSAAATSATVQRSDDGVTGWVDLAPAAAAGSPIGSFPSTGLAESTPYYYRVVMTNTAPAASAPSDPTSATTLLAAPTALFNNTAPTLTQVDLGWTNNSAHQTGFDIYRADGTPTTFVFKGHSVTTNFIDNTVTEGGQYYYQVRATNDTNTSAGSAPFAVATPLAAPTLFAGFALNAQVTLSWTDNSANETGFTIERSPNGSTGWVAVGEAPARPSTGLTGVFTDTHPLELTTQYYRICARNAFTCSAYVKSAAVVTITLNLPAPVSAYTMLGGARVKILWTDNSLLETGYQVQWSPTAGGPWSDVTAATPPNVTSYEWTIPNGSYFIRVRTLYSIEDKENSPYTVPVKVAKGTNWTFIPLVTK